MSGAPGFHPAQERALLLARTHGVDPREVAVNGLTEEGYQAFVFDVNGQTVFDIHDPDNVTALTQHRTWPEGFPVDEFLAAVREWQGAVL